MCRLARSDHSRQPITACFGWTEWSVAGSTPLDGPPGFENLGPQPVPSGKTREPTDSKTLQQALQTNVRQCLTLAWLRASCTGPTLEVLLERSARPKSIETSGPLFRALSGGTHPVSAARAPAWEEAHKGAPLG